MAISIIGRVTTNNIIEYQGLSTDTKPILAPNNSGSKFIEFNLTTGETSYYRWHTDQWIKMGVV